MVEQRLLLGKGGVGDCCLLSRLSTILIISIFICYFKNYYFLRIIFYKLLIRSKGKVMRTVGMKKREQMGDTAE